MSNELRIYFNIESVSLNIDNTIRITGWCFPIDLNQSAVLEFVSNNYVVDEVVCDIRRDDVRKEFYPDKNKNFKFPLSGFSSDINITDYADELIVREKASKEVLKVIKKNELTQKTQSPWIVVGDPP